MMTDIAQLLCPLCAVKLFENTHIDDGISSGCALCFSIIDSSFVDKIVSEVKNRFTIENYDSSSFALAINLPVTTILRETIFSNRISSNMQYVESVRKRVIDNYLPKLSEALGLYPSLNSDLLITLTFINDEFNESDVEFLQKNFPSDFASNLGIKRRFENRSQNSIYTKVRLSRVITKIDAEIASKYEIKSPKSECSFGILFETQPLYIASRYCKFSRNLSQSAWSGYEELPSLTGNSVSEKICKVLIAESRCDSTRFIASGREDIDVRMLGTGRPFVVQLINPRCKRCFEGELLEQTLARMEKEINKDEDIRLGSSLKKVTAKDTESLRIGQETKQKAYITYCYSSEVLTDVMCESLVDRVPFDIVQKTPVRVLKRRPLLDRTRTIYSINILPLDEHYFLMRIQTQAGTYVKEFVHGDFGRTRPSLADLFGLKKGKIDILELDVENVDLNWPPE